MNQLDTVRTRRCGLEDVDQPDHAGSCLWCALPGTSAPVPIRDFSAQLRALAERNRNRRGWVAASLRIEDGSLHIRSPLSDVSMRMDLDPRTTVGEILPRLIGVLHLPRLAPDGTPWSYSVRFATDWIVPECIPTLGLSLQRGLEFFLISQLGQDLPRR